MTTQRIEKNGLHVAAELQTFIDTELLPAIGVSAETFWPGFAGLVNDLAPKNAALLAKRDAIQLKMDAWHAAHPGPIQDMAAYQAFLSDIGYLVPDPGKVQATTANVDAELATQAGPQLVVPILNARYALNAANARWGSLYDALYGTDILSAPAARPGGYDTDRGAAVDPRGGRVGAADRFPRQRPAGDHERGRRAGLSQSLGRGRRQARGGLWQQRRGAPDGA